MTPLEEALRALAGRRKRLSLSELWRAFYKAHPVDAAQGNARELLLQRLEQLQAAGVVSLPSASGRAWDRSARSALPNWVLVPTPEPLPAPARPGVAWAPELAFAASLPGDEHLDALLVVQRFLATGGRGRTPVPMRERSVALFGDEKRLDRLARTTLFGPGRLSLDLLRCFPMAPPLVLERGPAEAGLRPLLVIENHHTWWSFCRWNEAHGAYAAVVYGAGGAFGREAIQFLAEQREALQGSFVLYFGDLDRRGLEIPWRAAHLCASEHGLQLAPATRWYEALLRRAEDVVLPVGAPIDAGEALTWMPDPLRSSVAAAFQQGRRIPQELVGTEVLRGEARERLGDLEPAGRDEILSVLRPGSLRTSTDGPMRR